MSCTHDTMEQATCPVCHFEPFVRNNYFDGKFMVARDFIDETHYHSEKLRHHQVRLHGWGVVCGLLAGQHSNEQCQDRYIRIQPGAAIDCCGREILVREEDFVDLKSQLKELYEKDRNNSQLHTLQVCIKFRECGTEDVPVLFDECGCDETKCDHNRILESYAIEVLVDPVLHPEPHHNPKDDWGYFLKSGGGWRTALRVAGRTRYAINPSNTNELLELDPDQEHVVAVRTLPANIKAIAVAESDDGAHVYVAAQAASGNAADPRRLLVFEAADLTTIKTEKDLLNSGGNDVFLAFVPAPDNRLVALVGGKDLLIWDNTLNTAVPQPAPAAKLTLNVNAKSLAVSSDGKHAYTLNTATPAQLVVVDIAATAPMLAAAAPIALPTLSHGPVAVAVGPSTVWLFVLEEDSSGSYIQVVDLNRMKANQQPSVVAERKIADAMPAVLALNNHGGVALLPLEDSICEDLVWKRHEHCPGCDIPNCVVLATIERYQLDARFLEGTPHPADVANKIARIDNRKGRRVLARTEVLQELIECLLRRGGGGGGVGPQGPQGPQGPRGPAGPGLEAGLTRIVAVSWVHNSRGVAIDPRVQQCFDPTGQFRIGGIVPVNTISELHQGDKLFPFRDAIWGFAILFNRPVHVYDRQFISSANPPNVLIDSDHVFELLVRYPLPNSTPEIGGPRITLRGVVVPVEWTNNAAGNVDWLTLRETRGPDAAGVAMLLTREGFSNLGVAAAVSDIFMKLRGDFVIDVQGRAVDVEFVRTELPTGDRPATAPENQFGIQGGLFESWFWLVRTEAPDLATGATNVNVANPVRVGMVRGMTPRLASSILAARESGPFTNTADFRRRVRPSDEEWRAIRGLIRFRG